MQFRVALVGLAGASLFASPVLADPVTYVGKLDKLDIVVELTSDPGAPNGPLAGRYLYLSQGADIPLQAKSQKGGKFELSEEEACKEECVEGKPGPIGATWSLSTGDGGKTLSGKWTSKKKTFDIKLSRAGSRSVEGEQPAKPLDLANFSFEFYYSEQPITMETSPYDYLRLDVPYEQSDKQGWPDASFVMASDPRTKFPRPRVLEVEGGASVEAANDRLRGMHWSENIAALGCKAGQYAGFQEYGPVPGGADGGLGSWDETSSSVEALTPKLMSWTESGSVFCGGAHPTNFIDRRVMNLATGDLVSLRDMFKDVSEDGKPGETLLGYVREAREKPTDQIEIDFEAECGTEDLVTEYLTASLKRDGDAMKVVFGLSGLPHVIQACGDDFMEVPAADVMPLMKPEFATLLEKEGQP
jgi:hypothetical protein